MRNTKLVLLWMIPMHMVIHISVSIPLHEQSVTSSDHHILQTNEKKSHFLRATRTSQVMSPLSNLLTTNSEFIVNLTRQHSGDIFWANGVAVCNIDTCVGLSSGTSSWLENNKTVHLPPDKLLAHKISRELWSSIEAAPIAATSSFSLAQKTLLPQQYPTTSPLHSLTTTVTRNAMGESCRCKCLPYLNSYREDLGICVDDIHECSLSPFVSGSSSEKIPFVFLPLRGQIIYPSREIHFGDINTPMCAVTGAQYLTPNGWSELRNPISNDYPFRMFRDEGRTFLQVGLMAKKFAKLINLCQLAFISVRKFSTPEGRNFASFNISAPESLSKLILDKTFWPDASLVKVFKPRAKKPVTSNSAAKN